MGSYSFWSALVGYAGSLPLLLVWLAGGALALAHWRQRPRVSLLCFLSMALMLVWFVAHAALYAVLPQILESATDMVWVYAALGALGSLVSACGFGLLLWALFGRHEA